MSGEFHSIRSLFERMILKVHRIIREHSTPLETLKLFLNDCYPDLQPQLDRTDTKRGVIHLIKGECTLIDIQPLESVVEEFEIKEAEIYIEEYMAKLEEFSKSISARLCLKENFEVANMTHQCQVATYIFDWEPDEYMLNDIKQILSKASGKLVKIKFIGTVL